MKYIVECHVFVDAENHTEAMDKVEEALYTEAMDIEVQAAWRQDSGFTWKD